MNPDIHLELSAKSILRLQDKHIVFAHIFINDIYHFDFLLFL